MNQRDCEHYIRQFADLNTSKNRRYWTDATKYQAPYKPFLLLSVLDLFEQGDIRSNLIELSHELGETFSRYCGKVWIFDSDSKIHLPFYHLRSEGFCHLLPNPGREDVLQASSGVQSLSQLRDFVVGTRLDKDLYRLLQTKECRVGLGLTRFSGSSWLSMNGVQAGAK